MALGKYHLAILDYQRALKKDPENSEVMGNLGVAYMLARDPIKAVACFHKALARETNPRWRERMATWRDKLLEDPKVKVKFARSPTKPKRVRLSESLW
jgi:Flp pilus assembly protein TadD